MALAVVLGGAGCQTRPESDDAADGGNRSASSFRWPSESGPQIRPLNEATGRVVQVNERLRFVVVDAGLNPLPAPETVLRVHREGQAVAELKSGRTARGSTLSADFVTGLPQVGDEVRWPLAEAGGP